MADAETLLNLQHDRGAVAQFLAQHDGSIDGADADSGVYWVTFRPCSAPAELYYARVAWDAYPFAPPSIKFGDGIRGSLEENHAWPVIPGYRTGSFDICKPMTKEGYAAHPEWAQGSTGWVSDGNPFLWIAQEMQFHMDNEYQGRGA
ncbi:MAG: hypothetical protein M3P18_19770 [Actinomycetota bacterium]|nr:hypothetical protein [Actinomycetota bacterium]